MIKLAESRGSQRYVGFSFVGCWSLGRQTPFPVWEKGIYFPQTTNQNSVLSLSTQETHFLQQQRLQSSPIFQAFNSTDHNATRASVYFNTMKFNFFDSLPTEQENPKVVYLGKSVRD